MTSDKPSLLICRKSNRFHSLRKNGSIAENLVKQRLGKGGENQNDQADHQYANGLRVTTFPFFQDNSPHIAEYDVERHQDTERQCGKSLRRGKEAFPDRQSEELTVPQSPGQKAEQGIIRPYVGFLVIAPSLVLLVLVKTVDGVRDETAQRHKNPCRTPVPH